MHTSLPQYLGLLPFLLAAAVTDARRQRIYNATTYPGIVAGLLLNAVLGALREPGGLEGAWTGLQHGGAGFLACGLVMLVCFVFFPMGGGDVKLIAMTGAFLGVDHGIEVMLWTFVCGAVIAIAMLVWRIGFLNLVQRVVGHLAVMLRVKSWVPLSEGEREPLQQELFLAIAALVAAGVVCWRRLYA